MTAVNLHLRLPATLSASLLAGLLLLAISPALAQAPATPPQISEIRIEGNLRVEDDAIRVHIASQPGQPLNEATVDQDIKAIYKMGFFDQVKADLRRQGVKYVLVFEVRERPLVSDVKLEGMKAIRTTDDKVLEAEKVHPHSILDPAHVDETVKGLEKVYQDKGYLDATVTFHTIDQPDNSVIAVFHVNEGGPVQITQIQYTGNRAFSGRQLSAATTTRTHNFLSFVTHDGVLDRKKLDEDVDRLTSFYYDHGYLNVHVAEPAIVRHGDALTVTFNIDEGQPYKVGSIGVEGELKFPEKELVALLTLKPGTLFRGSTMQHDVLTLSDFYSNHGYAFVNVDPHTNLDPARHLIAVSFAISPGQEVLIDRIKIVGNTKTSDKIIRREMRIQEQEPYSAEKIRESKERIERLGFFEETRINTAAASQPDRINLDVNVREANTATFQTSGGYSTASSVFGNFSLGNTNLFGGGQAIKLDATVGQLFQNYSISYTEPYFLDMPLSAGIDLFSTRIVFFNFDRSANGFGFRTFYPLEELGLEKIGPLSMKQVSAGLQYKFEAVGIGGFTGFTTEQILRFKGTTQTSEIIPSIRRFTVDNPIDPRHGSVQTLTVQIAGLGGDNYFVKEVAHSRFFLSFVDSPTWGNWVYSLGTDFGIGSDLKGGSAGELPLSERFFPGGTGGGGDVRGYELYRLGPRVTLFNQSGQAFAFEEVGGSKELLLSQEVTFPILEGLGIRGVVFTDAGNSFRLKDAFGLDKLQGSAGIGVRWRSPFGPLRIETAKAINPRSGDPAVDFVFGAGSPL